MATIEDFKQLDLRVGTIIEAEAIAGTDKLLRLIVDLGEIERQIVAGLALDYDPDKLIGTQIVMAAGLEFRKLKGVESQGMLLAASGENGKPILLMPSEPVGDGIAVS